MPARRVFGTIVTLGGTELLRLTGVGFFDCLLRADESNLAVGSIAERFRHRAAAPTEGDPGFALGRRFSFPLRNGNRISFVIDEIYVAVNPVGAVVAYLDRDVWHF